MIIQGNEFFRFLLIYMVNSLVIATFLIITVKILKRNKNQLTIVLSYFFLFAALSLGINAIYYPLRIEIYVYVLYFLALFIVFFCQIFPVLFNLILLNKGVRYPPKKIILIVLFYAIIIIISLSIPGGYNYNEKTNWRPVWTVWYFLIVLIINLCFIQIPFIFLYFKLNSLFEDKDIKKKLRWWLVGFEGYSIGLYGVFLNNTLSNTTFQIIWPVIATILAIVSGLIIYRAWGQSL